MLYNTAITSPNIILTFISNCHLIPRRIFTIGNRELKSQEGTTQSNPSAMGA